MLAPELCTHSRTLHPCRPFCNCLSTDVQKLVNDPSVLTPDALTAILREYNTEQMIAAPDLQGKPVLVTKYGQVGPDLYLDPNTQRVLRFDHNKRAFVEETDKKQQLSANIDSHRSAIHSALSHYVSESFKRDKATLAVYGADDGSITIAISARNVNLANYWTGSWRSTYTLTLSGGSSAELKGSVTVAVHYFEDGNVQLHSTQHTTHAITSDGAEAVAKRVAEVVSKFESEYQSALEEMYVNMHRTTFKAMRRLLPVNRQKFVWNAASHSLATEMNK